MLFAKQSLSHIQQLNWWKKKRWLSFNYTAVIFAILQVITRITNSSPVWQWFPLQAVHLAAFSFFPSFFQSSRFSLPASSSAGKFWSHFFRVSNNTKLCVCSSPKSSKRSVASVQCLISLTHQLLSSLKLLLTAWSPLLTTIFWSTFPTTLCFRF